MHGRGIAGIAQVLRGSASFGAGDVIVTASLGGTITPSRSVVILLGSITAESSNARINSAGCTALDATTIEFTRNVSGAALSIYWEVVEYR